MFEAISNLFGGKKKYGEPIIIVSGLPRSGTSPAAPWSFT